MAQKQLPNKKKQLLIENQSTPKPKQWPNLPQPLIALIAKHPNLTQNITSFGYVTKSWRSSTKKCKNSHIYPHIIEINTKNLQRNTFSHTIEIAFHEEHPFPYYKRRSYKRCGSPGKHWKGNGIYFKGHSHGQIVVMGGDLSDCCMWEPAKRCTRFLPSWDQNRVFKSCSLSAFPEDRDNCNVMVITGSCSPAFGFYGWSRGTNREWILEDCDIKEPYFPSQTMSFSNVIGFRGKFYALSLQGSLVVIEDIEGRCCITAMGGNRAVPTKVSRQFRECLVESNGEILLVFLISRKCIDVVDDVEVFRLDFEKLLWVKVESIGDRALFLEDECCVWADARMVGCKKNCVYFSHFRVDKWWRFDMESGRIEQEFMMWSEVMEVD